jgi:redox-sensitive bicupin YhaK (pirin superfamily)
MSTLPDHDPHCTRPHGDRTIDMLIASRPRDLGGFTVRRVLPSPLRRMVGPFTFFDHMGPTTFAPGTGLDVRPHPHINLATVTYLFDGEIIHKDNLGSDQAIRPGAVNWMSAGRGIAHSERTGPEARARGSKLHGIQSWVALPIALEESAPSFAHHAAESIPERALDGARVRVAVGSAFGLTSPVVTASPTFFVEANIDAGAELAIPNDYEERCVYVVDGAIACDGQRVDAGTMIVLCANADARIRADAATRVVIAGGAPIDGPRHIWWNFVSHSQERIEQAKRDWKEGRFAKIPGDDQEFIPLPER